LGWSDADLDKLFADIARQEADLMASLATDVDLSLLVQPDPVDPDWLVNLTIAEADAGSKRLMRTKNHPTIKGGIQVLKDPFRR
jgi:hypothetical protein